MGDNRCAKHKYYGIPPSHCFVCEVLALRAEVEKLRRGKRAGIRGTEISRINAALRGGE